MDFVALALRLLIGGGLGHATGEVPGWAHPEAPPSPVATVRAEAPAGADNPACRAEFCQPRVAIPGQQPQFDSRGKRTELVLAAIDGLQAGTISNLARAVNTAGIQVEWLPPQSDPASRGHGGLGKLSIGLRWRLDAWNGPVWAGAAR